MSCWNIEKWVNLAQESQCEVANKGIDSRANRYLNMCSHSVINWTVWIQESQVPDLKGKAAQKSHLVDSHISFVILDVSSKPKQEGIHPYLAVSQWAYHKHRQIQFLLRFWTQQKVWLLFTGTKTWS